jgi:hypothetical protein
MMEHAAMRDATGMSIDPNEAAASLEAVASVEERTRERLGYERTSSTIIFWGALFTAGYLLTYFAPHYADAGWIVISLANLAGTFLIQYRSSDPLPARRLGRFLAYGNLAVTLYGNVLLVLLWPMTPRQLGAFWPTLGMLAFVLAGIFFGRFFIYCGALVTAATVAGYFWAGGWFPLWMALIYGSALIGGGLWLRRAG